jgi:hypothetical protein
MKTERGFILPNPYLLLGLAIAWGISLFAVGVWQHKAGVTAERVQWQERETTALLAANQEITRLNAEARKNEADHAARLAAISTRYQEELTHAKAQRDRDIAAARAGARRLQFAAAGACADASARPEAGPAAGRCDGEARSQLRDAAGGDILALPGDISASLYTLAHDADDLARQLMAAQAVILEDRALCK